MEALLVLLGLAVLALPVAVIVLIVLFVQMRRDMRSLQALVAELQNQQVTKGDPTGAGASKHPDTRAPTPRPEAATPRTAPSVSMETSATDNGAEPPAAAPDQPAPERENRSATPWKVPDTEAPAAETPPTPKAPGLLVRLFAWLRDNWFYAVAAVSLALAGVFLVDYGVETGLLTPSARVAAALLFGAALIIGGEAIRRRSGDGEDSATAYLPSTLSGAGLVSIMGGILAARLLYDLVSPVPALAGLFGVAVFGLGLGWLYGPLLAAIGLIGGMAAPFLVGGETAHPESLLPYFALLSALGLGIDTLRRWAWVSVLAVALGLGAGAMLALDNGSETMLTAFACFALGLAVMTVLIPSRGLMPDHPAPSLAQWLKSDKERPIFPVWLAQGTLLTACFATLLAAREGVMGWSIGLCLMTALGLWLTLGTRRAPGLSDAAVLPAGTILILIGAPEANVAILAQLKATLAEAADQTETRMPWTVTLTLLSAVLLSLSAAWRSLTAPEHHPVQRYFWAGAAVLLAPIAGLVLEFTWQPATLLGAWPWALHALALGGGMVALALRFAAIDGADRLRVALAAISALSCLAFALTVILTDAALTLALAAVVISAAALDRRFDLRPLAAFVVAGLVALGTRLLAIPGLDWAFDAPAWEGLLAFGGSLGAAIAAHWLIAHRDRARLRVMTESAAWAFGAMTVSLALFHVVEALGGHNSDVAHWVLGLQGSVWTAAALAQIARLRLGGLLWGLRVALACVFGLTAIGLLLGAVAPANPLFGDQSVQGAVLFNTLAPAYLLPAAVMAIGAWRLGAAERTLTRFALGGIASAFGALWLGLSIRHFWQGGNAMGWTAGIAQPELYTYTVALLVLGGALFYQALARRAPRLRQAGVAVIGLAVLKVFLIDISGLDGLARVFSFLALGLVLVGLAWVNRWVQLRASNTGAEPSADP